MWIKHKPDSPLSHTNKQRSNEESKPTNQTGLPKLSNDLWNWPSAGPTRSECSFFTEADHRCVFARHINLRGSRGKLPFILGDASRRWLPPITLLARALSLVPSRPYPSTVGPSPPPLATAGRLVSMIQQSCAVPLGSREDATSQTNRSSISQEYQLRLSLRFAVCPWSKLTGFDFGFRSWG